MNKRPTSMSRIRQLRRAIKVFNNQSIEYESVVYKSGKCNFESIGKDAKEQNDSGIKRGGENENRSRCASSED